MSTTIDQRVVEMRFDNQHFEKNVSTTMSTLDKLKQKLNLSSAAKGLDDIDSAAKKVNMGGLGAAVDTVSAKFSALQVMGVTALANITNSAVNAGKSIIKSLTIDPVKSGFEEYETKMGSIQTILANTEHQGTTLDDVTAALEKLNLYADKTIYNFQQMTRNIGTFTAAGVDLETSVKSIQGIANLAAVSGSTSQQASTAMYQLSQALASGTVKLQDWNSVVNAGMGGKVFQNALIRTAAMLDGAADDVEAWQKKNVDAYGSFRESLTQGAWLTTDVLTKTLEQFTMAAEEGTAEWEAYKKSLMDSGYTEKQAEEILKMANTATDAATKVKTFTQLLDTLKESAQSGWAQTWELLVGDFEEAKEFFTQLSDLFGGIIGESAERRNNLLGGALNSNWDKLISKINEAGIQTTKFEESIRKVVGDDKLDSLIQEYGSLEKAVKKGKISTDDLKKALDGIGVTSADTKLSGIVKGLKEIKNVLGLGNVGDDVKKLQAALDELGYDLGAPGIDGIIGPITEKAIKAFQEANGLVVDGIAGPETLAALEKAAGKLGKVTDEAGELQQSLDELIDDITKKGGRELLLESLLNVIKAIRKPLSAVTKALRKTFSVDSGQIYNLIENLHKFTELLIISDERAAKLQRTFEGLFSIVKIFTTIAGGGIKIAFKVLTALLEKFDMGILDFTAMVGDALVGISDFINGIINTGIDTLLDWLIPKLSGASTAIKDWIDTIKQSKIGHGIIDGFKAWPGILEKVGSAFSSGVTAVSEWLSKIGETEIFKTVAGWFSDASDTISEAISTISDKISNFKVSGFGKKLDEVWNDISDLSDKLNSNALFSTVKTGAGAALGALGEGLTGIVTELGLNGSNVFTKIVDGVAGAFKKLWDLLPKFKLPKFNLDSVTSFFQNLVKIGEKAGSSSGSSGMITAVDAVGKHLKDNVFSWNWTVFKETALEKFVTFWIKTGDKIKAAFEVCKDVFKSILTFVFGTEKVDLPTILDLAEKFLGIIVLVKTLNLLNGLVKPFDNVSSALDNFAGSLKWSAMEGTFKAMAVVLGVLTTCIVILANMPDMNKAWQAAGMLAGLMVIMGGVAIAMTALSNKVGGDMNIVPFAAGLLMIIASVALLTHTIKKIDNLNLNNVGQTFSILAGILVAMTAGVRMISKAAGSSFRSVAAILTLLAAMKLILEVIEDYDKFDWTGKSLAIQRMGQMMVMLSIAINLASRGIKAGASAQGLALLLLAMVFSLKLLIGVIEQFAAMDSQVLLKGGGVVVALLAVMTIMANALGKANKGMVLEKGQRSVNNFAGLAMALLAVVAAIWMLGKMPLETLKQGGLAVAGILILFTGLLSAIGKSCSGLKMGVIITMLVGFAVLMAELAVIVKCLEEVPWQNALGSASALSIMLLSMAAVLRILSTQNVKAGNIFKWIGAMSVLALVLGEMAFVLYSIKNMDPLSAIGNAAALSILIGAMSGVLLALTKHRNKAKSIYKWIGAMAVLGLVVAEFAFVLYSIKDLDPLSAIGNATALSGLMAVMAGVLVVLNKCPADGKNIGKWILALAGLGLVAAELAFILKSMTGIDGAIENASALALLAVALSVAMVPLSFASSLVNAKMLNGVLTLAAMAAILGVLVFGLSKITGIETARANAITLANLAVVLSICTIPLAAASLIAPAATTGVILLVALAAMLGLLVQHLSYITGVDTARENAITLANLAIVLSLCTIPLALAGLMAPGAIAGAGLLAALAIVLGLLVWGLSAIKNIDAARSNTETIIMLLESISKMIVDIGSLGFHALTAVAAINMLITVITKIGVLAAAIGLLTNDGSLIEKGLSILKKIAGGLGEIISAFALGLTSDLPEIADNLSKFVEKAEPFVTLVKGIGDDVATGAGNLAKAVMVFLAADFMAGIANKAGLSLADFGTDLSKFADNIDGFISAMGSVKEDTVAGVEMLCSALAALTTANLKDAWTQLMPGDNSLGNFGTNIEEFATCIKNAAEALKDVTDEDVANIKRSAVAGEALATLNSAIPSQGGWVQTVMGSKELDAFGQSIVAFADCLVVYSDAVSGKNIDAEAIKNSAVAGQAIAELNGAIPLQGGWAQTVMGSKDLITFGQSIVAFADCLVDYSAKVTGQALDKEAIIRSADAADALATLNGKLPSQNGLWQAIAGEKDMGEFGTRLVSFAEGLLAYSNTAVQIDETKIEAIKNSGLAIDELVKVVGKVPNDGGWGEAIFGSNDGQSFGAALSSMASGISSYCATAATINADSITAIQNSGKAIDELKLVLDKVPETTYSEKTSGLRTAIADLINVGNSINRLSTSSYDYSGLATLKTAISTASGMFTDISISGLMTNFSNLERAVIDGTEAAAKLQDLNQYTYGGIKRFKDALSDLSGVNLDEIIDAFSGRGDEMASAMESLTKAMSSGLESGSTGVSDAMNSLVKNVVRCAKDKADDFKTAGKSFATKLADGIKSATNSVSSAAKSIGTQAAAGARSKYSGMYVAGQYLGTGLVNGINSKKSSAYWAGYALGQMAVQGEKDGQRSNSPSKATIKAGKWLGEGLVIGMNRMGDAVYNAGRSMGASAVGSISNSISKISDIVSSDIDAQPTIRPVLDLSDIRAGAGTIGSLLGVDSAIGVMTNAGTINTMMNRRGQNGGNGDIVSAIDKLRKDLGNVGNTSYNINGITYDRGSELDDALRTIVRYARIEGRV